MLHDVICDLAGVKHHQISMMCHQIAVMCRQIVVNNVQNGVICHLSAVKIRQIMVMCRQIMVSDVEKYASKRIKKMKKGDNQQKNIPRKMLSKLVVVRV